jgi:hypothetical protein
MPEQASGTNPSFSCSRFSIAQHSRPGALIEVDAEGDLQN